MIGKYETERRKCWLEPSSRVLARRCLPSTREAQRLDVGLRPSSHVSARPVGLELDWSPPHMFQ